MPGLPLGLPLGLPPPGPERQGAESRSSTTARKDRTCWLSNPSLVSTQLGWADVVVNNAAIHYDTWQRASSADLDIVEQALQTNLLGAWRSPHPRIVNVSSEGGSISEMTGGTPAYSVSKAALNALTRLLAGELRPDRILVNAVCPGWTATDMGGGGDRPISAGAASVVWAALLPDDGPTGGFYRDGRPLPW